MNLPSDFPLRNRTLIAWLESLTLPLISVGLAWWLIPERTFNASFPWIWLAPVLVALRYGLLPSLASITVLVLVSYALQSYGFIIRPWSREQFIGGVLLTVLCGQFGDLWRRRLERQNFMARYSEERLQALTRDFYITRLSHDILEQALITEPATLRNALQDLHRRLGQEQASLEGGAVQELMTLLGVYGRLEAAALFRCDNLHVERDPVATLGTRFTLDPADPLVTEAMEKDLNAYYSVAQLVSERTSRYLAVLPLKSYHGRRYGLLVIRDMAFLALNEENLLMLAAILGYFADEITAYEDSRPLREKVPACPPRFARELLHLAHLKFLVGMDSILLGIVIPASTRQHQILETLERSKRGLDLHWRVDAPDGAVILLKLMPLTRTVGAEGFLHRIDALLQDRFHADRRELGLRVHYEPLPTINMPEWLHDELRYLQRLAREVAA